MAKRCIVVAESSRVRIFEQEKLRAPLIEISDFSNSAARLHERELGADIPGRGFSCKGGNKHCYEPPTTLKEQEAINFSKQICGHIERVCATHQFLELILIAPPDFLGLIRKNLAESTKKLVTHEINKNLVREDLKTILQHIP